jgi:5-methylcytosine-specific restriction endonuclease McrA
VTAAQAVRGLHPVLGTPLPAITQPVAPEWRDWNWAGNARRRLALVGLVLRLKGTRCHLCGLPGATSADHVIPHAHGGPNTVDNLEPAHQACNSVRQDRPLSVWFAAHPVRLPARRPSREW